MATASFGRKWLAGIIRNDDLSPEEKEQAIMDGHIAVTDGIKDDRDKWKEQAEKVPDLQKQIDSFNGGEDWKKKYEDEHKAFEDFKKSETAKATENKIRSAYKKLLMDEKISEEWADKICRLEDFSKMKLDAEGNLADLDSIRSRVQKEYGGYILTTSTKGAVVETPPKTSGKTMTREEILAIKDTSARQKAIAENIGLFR